MRQASVQLGMATRTSQPKPRPIPIPRRLSPDSCQIDIIDAATTPYADGGFDLIVSSPPFGLDVAYADGGDVADYATYRHLMATWSAELCRVSNPRHGRVCLEVPLDRSKGRVYEPVYAHWLQALEQAGLNYRTTITRRYHAGRGTARGSVDSPGGPHTFSPLMTIIVVHRGAWIRRGDEDHDLEHDAWLALTGPTANWDDLPGAVDPKHPAPFPVELPRRLIKLLSFREDLVGDLFLGRGTTALACIELGRRFRGGDRSPTYVALAQERASAALALGFAA